MVDYFKLQQFAADNSDLCTSDEMEFHVRYRPMGTLESAYFQDTTNRQEYINKISFGGFEYSGRQIKSQKIHREIGLMTDQLAIDTLSITVESEIKPSVTRYTPIMVYRDSIIVGKFYNGQIKEIGNRYYTIYAESDVALLDFEEHAGGIYSNVTIETAVADIMGDIPYAIHPIIKDKKIYGWLPYAKKRENIQQIIMATGITIRRDTDSTMFFTILINEISSSFIDSNVFSEGTLDENTAVTAVQVTEHAFVEIDESIALFSGQITGEQLIKFSEPAHSLVVTGGTIVESSVNHAIINGSGTVNLTGKKYLHTTKIITEGDILNTPDDKIVTVTNATLVTGLNSTSVAKRLYAYLSCNKSINQDVLVSNEKPGDIVTVVHPYTNEELTAAIASIDFNYSSTIRGSAKFLLGYVPQGEIGGYTHRDYIISGTTWKVPPDVTEIRAILISGGTGGQAGYNGSNGEPGGSFPELNHEVNASPYSLEYNGKAGSGGSGGQGGSGGKIRDTGAIIVTPGQDIALSIGAGGAAGLINGEEGAAGGVTTFGAFTSATGVSNDNGYVDMLSLNTFGTKGIKGYDGQDGIGKNNLPSPYMDSRMQKEYLPVPGDIDYSDLFIRQTGKLAGISPFLYWGFIQYGSKYSHSIAGGGGGGSYSSNGGDSQGADWSANSGLGFLDGGKGGDGADCIDPAVACRIYGGGGNGGHGGGGGGGGGAAYNHLTPPVGGASYHLQGRGGSGGTGSAGSNGKQGCIIIYY